jgi:hypothetical protein
MNQYNVRKNNRKLRRQVNRERQGESTGDMVIVRNADNVLPGFEREADARRFLEGDARAAGGVLAAFPLTDSIEARHAPTLIFGESMRRGESQIPKFWGGGELRLLATKTSVNGVRASLRHRRA